MAGRNARSKEMRDPNLPGPDGINSADPLVRTGVISPVLVPNTVATFTGGFKRLHGAFRHGPLARRNHGSHYGFVEQGVVFSKLQPGLATLYVLDDGSVDMKTWTTQDNALLPHIKYALQNGVPLVDYDLATERTVPGGLVADWGAGNWSGSSDEQLRSLRARRLSAADPHQTLSHLRLFLRRHSLRNGEGIPVLRLPLRHAFGHERP